MRTIQSKATRFALWEYSNGKCQICGVDVGADFEVDHIIPVSRGGDSGMSNLQILCRKCNRRKSDKMITPRRHQKEMLNVVGELIDEVAEHGAFRTRQIVADVTPGGGKSVLPVILFSKLYEARLIDKVVIVVPRLSLQRQAEEGFEENDWRAILKHSHRIRTTTNERDPFRGLAGCVTTYQALGAARPSILDELMASPRTLLVLDEFHHLSEDARNPSPLTAAVKKILPGACLCLFMTGTVERGDKLMIPLLEYEARKREGGERRAGYKPLLENKEGQKVIRYSRSDALRERAIIKIDFEHVDGLTEYLEGDERIRVKSIAALDHPGTALHMALESEYAFQVLDKAVGDWNAYRRTHPRSKMLVVAHSQHAVREYLRERAKGWASFDIRPTIAISDDDASKENIDAFKQHHPSAPNLLITVAMAYEGLDVPACTHIACLTRFRSRPWIEQMLARAVRVDRLAGPYESQRAFCYAPDDGPLHAAISKIIEEQEAVAFVPEEGPPGPTRDPIPTVPLISQATNVRARDGNDGGYVDYEKSAAILRFMEREGIAGVSIVQMHNVMEACKAESSGNVRPESADMGPSVTPSREEERLKGAIKKHVNAWCKENQEDYENVNARIKQHFGGKSRPEMGISELVKVLAYVVTNLPLRKGGANDADSFEKAS